MLFDLLQFPRLLKLLAFGERARYAKSRRQKGPRSAAQHRDQFYAACWREAAEALGGTIEHLDDEIYEITVDDFRTRVCRNYTPVDDPVTLMLAGNKPATHRQLAARGLPIPTHLEFTLESASLAADFLQQSAGPCVIKPAKDTGAGRGVTTNITRRSHLVKALLAAAAHGPDLLIERQVPGDVYRLLYLDGILLDAVVRHPPAVFGDGQSSIVALLEGANAERLRQGAALAQVTITRDVDMMRTLAAQGWTLASILPKGTKAVLKTVINDNAAVENDSAVDRLCPALIEAGAAAASAVGARLAGIDVVTPDPGQPLEATGGVILEVNTTPGFFYHYRKRGEPCLVAVHVLERLRALPSTLTSTGYAP